MSLTCEMFGCTPTVAIRELEDGPFGLIAEIAELRAYREALAMVERAERDPSAELRSSEMTSLVMEIRAMLMRERIDRMRGGSEG